MKSLRANSELSFLTIIYIYITGIFTFNQVLRTVVIWICHSKSMRLISEEEAQTLLDSLSPQQASSILRRFEDTLVDLWKAPEAVQQPLRTALTRDDPSVTTLVMPVANKSGTSTKIVTLPTGGNISAVTVVMDPDGEIIGMVGAAELTAFRTALAIMCAFTKWQPARHVVIFGAGNQAKWHIKLIRLLADGPPPDIVVVNRSVDRLDALCKALDVKGMQPTDDRLVETLEQADAVFCCTPSLKPLFGSLPNTKPRFYGLIGSYKPTMHEITTETLLSGRLLVDSSDACLEESGEIIDAGLGQGDMTEMGDFLDSGQRLTGNVVVKCVGMGIMDLFASRELINLADVMNRGLEVGM